MVVYAHWIIMVIHNSIFNYPQANFFQAILTHFFTCLPPTIEYTTTTKKGRTKHAQFHSIAREHHRLGGNVELLHRHLPADGSTNRIVWGVFNHPNIEIIQTNTSLAWPSDIDSYIQGVSQRAHPARVFPRIGYCCLCELSILCRKAWGRCKKIMKCEQKTFVVSICFISALNEQKRVDVLHPLIWDEKMAMWHLWKKENAFER